MLNFLCSVFNNDENKEVADWIVKSFPVIEIVLLCLLALCSIVMIVLVCMQKTDNEGISALSGKSDTFYNRNKGATLQGKIQKWTTIVAIVIMVICVMFIVMNGIFPRF